MEFNLVEETQLRATRWAGLHSIFYVLKRGDAQEKNVSGSLCITQPFPAYFATVYTFQTASSLLYCTNDKFMFDRVAEHETSSGVSAYFYST